MNRCYALVILLIVKNTVIQAQSVSALSTLNGAQTSALSKAAPAKSKATESSFYGKIYGFYGLLTPGSEFLANTDNTQNTPTKSFKVTKIGLGSGLRSGIGVGVIISDFINLGVDAEWLFAKTLKTETTNIGANASTSNTKTSAVTLAVASIIPNITFKALSRPAYYIYNRIGISVGKVIDFKNNDVYIYPGYPTNNYNVNQDYTKISLVIGYQAALGIQVRLNQHIRGFVEVVGYNQSFHPQESVSTVTGSNTSTQSTISYQDQADKVSTPGLSTPGPTTKPTFNVPMNSLGVGMGLTVRF